MEPSTAVGSGDSEPLRAFTGRSGFADLSHQLMEARLYERLSCSALLTSQSASINISIADISFVERETGMALRAVVFDLGGVLELDVIELVDHGLDTRWEARLGLQAGELGQRMEPFWRAGSVGTCTEAEVHQGMRERLGMSQEQVEEYMREVWDWYCGRLNVPLADYFRASRPR